MKNFSFEINLNLMTFDVQAETEREARAHLLDSIIAYFNDTELAIDESEAKLLEVNEV